MYTFYKLNSSVTKDESISSQDAWSVTSYSKALVIEALSTAEYHHLQRRSSASSSNERASIKTERQINTGLFSGFLYAGGQWDGRNWQFSARTHQAPVFLPFGSTF